MQLQNGTITPTLAFLSLPCVEKKIAWRTVQYAFMYAGAVT